MSLWEWLRGKKHPADNRAASGKSGISRCRYYWCTNCNALYAKDATLNGWQGALMLGGHTTVVFGTRTCKCGKVMQVQDIYNGLHDLPRQYWGQVQGPVEVD